MLSDAYNNDRSSSTQNPQTLQEADDQERLNMALFAAIHAFDSREMEELLALNADPAFQDRQGMNALHHVAAMGARECFLILIKNPRCDFLALDHSGCHPAELASSWSEDHAMARLLTSLRVRKARELGVPLRERAPRPA